MLARDVMTSPAISAAPDTTIVEIVDIMLEHRISAVPIVDDSNAVVGIVSEGDLIRSKRPGEPTDRSWWLSALGGQAVSVFDRNAARDLRAADIMTRDVAMAHADTPLQRVAEMLDRTRVKRLPIIEAGQLVGIVSRTNLLQALTARRAAMDDHPSEDDRALRTAVMKAIREQSTGAPVRFNAVVRDATAYFWGDIDSEDHRDHVIAAARAVPGIRNVVDHMQVFPAAT